MGGAAATPWIPALLSVWVTGAVLFPSPAPGFAPGQPDPSEAVRRLGYDLTNLFEQPGISLWGVDVRSLDRGETLYALNPRTLLDPASTLKIVTLATAADRLGWDYRYETELLAPAVADGVVTGDLVVRGTGDPAINPVGSDREVFVAWAAELQAAGIDRVDGRVVGDDSAFADDIWTGWGPGWGWDDLGFGFAAPAGALQHHENVTELTIRPADKPGDLAVVHVDPLSGLEVLNEVQTGSRDAEPSLTLRRLPGPSDLVLRGTIPAGAPTLSRSVAVDNPTRFFVSVLRQTLIAGGIAISGEAVDLDDLPAAARPDPRRLTHVVVHHRSPPLADIAIGMMKDSLNLHAESLLRAIGLASPDRSVADGIEVVTETLASWGLDDDQFQIADGSGLSPLNLVTAETLVAILSRLHAVPTHRDAFERVLPVAGLDGTLSARLRGTAAAGNVRAKTGTKAGVRGLAGYIDTRDGERLGFAILANNFRAPGSEIVEIIDAAVARLASFSRE